MKIHWVRACAGALIAEITQIAAAFGWVAIYSYLINPGQPMAEYGYSKKAPDELPKIRATNLVYSLGNP